jgi:Holliday junction resolvase RusA-like endonuclease
MALHKMHHCFLERMWDVDNLVRIGPDAMSKTVVYIDDATVVTITSTKEVRC